MSEPEAEERLRQENLLLRDMLNWVYRLLKMECQVMKRHMDAYGIPTGAPVKRAGEGE